MGNHAHAVELATVRDFTQLELLDLAGRGLGQLLKQHMFGCFEAREGSVT